MTKKYTRDTPTQADERLIVGERAIRISISIQHRFIHIDHYYLCPNTSKKRRSHNTLLWPNSSNRIENELLEMASNHTQRRTSFELLRNLTIGINDKRLLSTLMCESPVLWVSVCSERKHLEMITPVLLKLRFVSLRVQVSVNESRSIRSLNDKDK